MYSQSVFSFVLGLVLKPVWWVVVLQEQILCEHFLWALKVPMNQILLCLWIPAGSVVMFILPLLDKQFKLSVINMEN